MRVALAQTNPRLGDFAGNLASAQSMLARAAADNADVIVFPEFTLIGYPPRNLLLQRDFIDDSLHALAEFATSVTNLTAIVGYAEPNTGPAGKPLRNALAVLADGRIASRHYKQLLPTYDVFDEARYFEPTPPPNSTNVATLAGHRVGITICEDLWSEPADRSLYHTDPVQDLIHTPTDWVVNISASPYGLGKPQSRPQMYARQARRLARPLVVVNQVGAYDDLIFDGNSFGFDPAGNLIAHCNEFAEDLLTVDLPSPGRIERPADGMESVYHALLFALREFARKSGEPFAPVGGPDTLEAAVVTTLATHALGPFKPDGIPLATANKTDFALGQGNLTGLLAPLGDLTAGRVVELARWMNIVPNQFTRPASPGLDDIVIKYIEQDQGWKEITAAGLNEAYVKQTIATIDAAEWRRRQSATPLKLTRRSFGSGRPMPLVR